jgi:predicted metal-binding membrane protein
MAAVLQRWLVTANFAFGGMERPEKCLLGLSLLAWILLARLTVETEAPLVCVSAPNALVRLDGGLETLTRTGTIFAEFGGWLVMVAAMMFPLVLEPVRHVAFRSLRDRRGRAVAGFLVGYSAAWMAAGIVAIGLVLSTKASGLLAAELVGPAIFAAAALWQYSEIRRRALRRCHRTAPLPPRGLRADLACLRFGASHGLNCVLACGLAMFALLMLPHGLLLCGTLAALMFVERGSPEPSETPLAVLLAGVAVAWPAMALLGA